MASRVIGEFRIPYLNRVVKTKDPVQAQKIAACLVRPFETALLPTLADLSITTQNLQKIADKLRAMKTVTKAKLKPALDSVSAQYTEISKLMEALGRRAANEKILETLRREFCAVLQTMSGVAVYTKVAQKRGKANYPYEISRSWHLPLIMIRTPPIMMPFTNRTNQKPLPLGRFELWAQHDLYGGLRLVSTRACEPYIPDQPGGIYLAHTNGRLYEQRYNTVNMCWGNSKLQSFLALGQLQGFADAAIAVLSTVGGHPMRHPLRWRSTTALLCNSCGLDMHKKEAETCTKCKREYCSDEKCKAPTSKEPDCECTFCEERNAARETEKKPSKLCRRCGAGFNMKYPGTCPHCKKSTCAGHRHYCNQCGNAVCTSCIRSVGTVGTPRYLYCHYCCTRDTGYIAASIRNGNYKDVYRISPVDLNPTGDKLDDEYIK